jgi:hypothetical protein
VNRSVTVHLPAPDEELPSGPLWTFIEDDGDGLVVAGRPEPRHVALTARDSISLTKVRLRPDVGRTVAAALLAAADHADEPEATA